MKIDKGGIQAKKYSYWFVVMVWAGLLFVILFSMKSRKTEMPSETVIWDDRIDPGIDLKNPIKTDNRKLFEELWKENEETVAWIKIPGTKIDYPVVQANDNEKYLNMNFEGEESVSGAIYMDCDCKQNLETKQMIFYGHHMRNGSMFAPIVDFKEESFFQKHREIILFLPEETVRLRTIAAVLCGAEGMRRKTEFCSQNDFEEYMNEVTKGCVFREFPEQKIDRLYAFVTCSYEFENARTILYAVREDLW